MARNAYTHSEDVAKVARTVGSRGGTKQEAFAESLHLQECPGSYNTWNKHYGSDFEKAATEVKLDMTESAQNVVKKHLSQDSLEAAKFVLERKGGWNKVDINAHVVEEASEEEELGVKEKLAEALGRRGLFVNEEEEDETEEG